MDKQISGIHHITAIAGDPQANVNFYVGLLGLRLVKMTVNFDDPGSYHLYYGDGAGHPGTIMTFFPWGGAPRGRRGNGQVTASSFAIPGSSLNFWTDRLAEHRVAVKGPQERFGEQVISFSDPDGLVIELIASSPLAPERIYLEGPVPSEHAIHGFHSATLTGEGYKRTANLLSETMGFKQAGQEGNRFRYATGSGGPGAMIDVLCAPEEPRGRVAVGTVHHIAFRTPDEANQLAWLQEIERLGYNVSPVMDRQYFHSIYYREPGGILFEIATDPPGFAIDEAPAELGASLKLPPWLESSRAQIVEALPRLHLPMVEPTK